MTVLEEVLTVVFTMVFLVIFWTCVWILSNREYELRTARAYEGVVVNRRSRKTPFGCVKYYIELDCEVFACGSWRKVRRKYCVPFEYFESVKKGSRVAIRENYPAF